MKELGVRWKLPLREMSCQQFREFSPAKKKNPRLQYYGVKGPGFDPRSRHYSNDIKDWLSLASESEYDWNNLMQRKSSKQPNPTEPNS